MSIEALRWSMDTGVERKLEPTQRQILWLLGNIADPAGYLYPSIGYIATQTGLARRTIQVHCKAMEEAGLFRRTPRTNGNGDRTSDGWQLAMKQPGLALEGGANSAPPRAADSRTPARLAHPGGAAAAPNTQEVHQEEKTDRGRDRPSPVALAFKAYQDGIRAKYRTEYPPSKRANGILANVVSRVGGPQAPEVVRAYFASQNPFYAKVKHKLEFLVRDCEQLLMDTKAGGGEAPTKAKVYLLAGDGTIKRDLGEVPAGDLLAIAKKAAQEYASLIARLEPRYVGVRQGAERRQFSMSDLR